MANLGIPNLHDLSRSTGIPPALLARTEADLSSVVERLRPIIEAVRLDGDAALLRFARELDRVEAPEMSLCAGEAEFEQAFRRIEPAVLRAIE